MSDFIGTQDPRVKRTLNLLNQSLLELLAVTKLEKISVLDITKKAGVNRSTFYAHYYDKYALYRHLIRSLFLHEIHQHLPESTDLTRDTIPHFITGVVLFFLYLNKSCPQSDRELRPMAELELQRIITNYLNILFQPPNLGSTQAQGSISAKVLFLSWGIFGTCLDLDPHCNKTQQLATVDALTEFLYQCI